MKAKRALAGLLTAAMLTSGMTLPAMAASFTDTDGHWGENAIDRWADHGIVNGSDGAFRPDDQMTRAEMAVVVANLLGLTDKAENTFADLNDDDWYTEAMLLCAKAGIILGDGTNMNPNATITRQESAVILARALGIQPAEGDASFNDSGEVADWAEGYIKAMTEKGILNGMGDNNFAPLANINRAAVATILDQSISGYANTEGATIEASSDGITLVAAPNVTITGSASDVLVTDGAAGGSVNVNGANVSGTLTVTGSQTTVEVSGNAAVGSIVVTEGADSAKVSVDKTASVGEISTEAPKTEVSVSGKVDTVSVAGSASDTTVQANTGSTISSVDNKAEGTTVSGSGKVDSVTTSGDNTTITTPGTKVDVAEGTSGTTANGKDVAAGESTTTTPSTPSGGGSSSSGGSSSGGGSSHSHSWDEGKVTTAATCTKEGVKTYTCSCGQTKTEEIAALGHNFAEDFSVDKAATCTEAGSKSKHCSRCDEKSEVTEIPVVEHKFDEGKVTAAATCTKEGVKTYTCTVCQSTKTEPIDKIDHTYENGFCSVCGEIDTSVKVSSLDELKAALTAQKALIVLTEDITTSDQINVDYAVTINGNGKKITSTNNADSASNAAGILVTAGATIKNLTVSGPNNTASGWDEGEYGIKVFNTTGVKLEDVTVTKANAGIQVNSSEVALSGTITVSGNEFGGIEVCKSKNDGLPAGSLIIESGSKVVCTNNTIPAIWIDGLSSEAGTVTPNGFALYEYNTGTQLYYFTDSAYATQAVAQIGSKLYSSLNSAIDAANETTEIVLLKNFELTEQLTINNAITLNGNGKTITAGGESAWSGSNSSGGYNIINITAAATLKNITLDSASKAWGLQAYCAGKVTLDTVTLTNSKGSGLTVNGSEVTATNLNTSDNAWQGVNVDNGDGVPENSSSFKLVSGSLSESFQIKSDKGKVSVETVPEGYSKYQMGTVELWSTKSLEEISNIVSAMSLNLPAAVVKSDVTVLYGTLQAALANMAAGETVEILADINLDGQITSDWAGLISVFSGTINGNNHTIYADDTNRGYLVENSKGSVTIKNLTVVQNEKFLGLICNANYLNQGSVLLENITVQSAAGTAVKIENNDSSFITFIGGGNGSSVTFKNCRNEANLNNVNLYSGIFVGGYIGGNSGTVAGGQLTFDGCVNTGTVTGPHLGFFTGNECDEPNPEYITIANCANEGTMTATISVNWFACNNGGKAGSVAANEKAASSATGADKFVVLNDLGLNLTVGNDNILTPGAATDSSIAKYEIAVFAQNKYGNDIGNSYVWLTETVEKSSSTTVLKKLDRIVASSNSDGITWDDVSTRESYTNSRYVIQNNKMIVNSEDMINGFAGASSVTLDSAPRYRVNAYDNSNKLIGTIILRNENLLPNP